MVSIERFIYNYELLFIMRGRPRCRRRIGRGWRQGLFKPQGIPASTLETVTLTKEEAEALRLVDANGKNQEDAATTMSISQPTLHRELKSARQKVADALLNQKAINIGGETMPNRDGTGPEGKGPRTGRGLGKCAPSDEETAPVPGRGMGLGRGRGRRGR
ncbi:DUF134 domain-containing protein [Candidatus Woesearchaeota archaeon]|nr:DUF134 domain-containing protein [Candidatus Woesearchaeota archaeon]